MEESREVKNTISETSSSVYGINNRWDMSEEKISEWKIGQWEIRRLKHRGKNGGKFRKASEIRGVWGKVLTTFSFGFQKRGKRDREEIVF